MSIYVDQWSNLQIGCPPKIKEYEVSKVPSLELDMEALPQGSLNQSRLSKLACCCDRPLPSVAYDYCIRCRETLGRKLHQEQDKQSKEDLMARAKERHRLEKALYKK